MTDPGDTADTTHNTQAESAEFVRVLSGRVRSISGDPKQMREMVYELARLRLAEQFTHADARESRQILQVLECAIDEVERSFERDIAAASPDGTPVAASAPLAVATRLPTLTGEAEPRRPVAPSQPFDGWKTTGMFGSVARLAAILLFVVVIGAVIISWARMKTQFAGLSPRASTIAQPQAAPTPHQSEVAESSPERQKEPAQPAMPLPITFGVYALSEGQLQELKTVP
jgi:hypothetical protein